jgi:hypothetical protein
MKASEFDAKFDQEENIIALLDLSQATRPGLGQTLSRPSVARSHSIETAGIQIFYGDEARATVRRAWAAKAIAA